MDQPTLNTIDLEKVLAHQEKYLWLPSTKMTQQKQINELRPS